MVNASYLPVAARMVGPLTGPFAQYRYIETTVVELLVVHLQQVPGLHWMEYTAQRIAARVL